MFGTCGCDTTDETELDEAEVEIGKGARKARKKVDLKVVVSASLGDCSNIFEKLFISVGACGFAKGV